MKALLPMLVKIFYNSSFLSIYVFDIILQNKIKILLILIGIDFRIMIKI